MDQKIKAKKINLKKLDLLKELYEKNIDGKAAQKIFNSIMVHPSRNLVNPSNLIGIRDDKEFNALVFQDIALSIVARWRYEGWPNRCVVCQKTCLLEKDEGFAFKKLVDSGRIIRNNICHWDCRPPAYASLRNLSLWHTVEKIIEDLEKKLMIRCTTVKDFIIGEMVLSLKKYKK